MVCQWREGNDSNDCKSSLTACKTIGHAISLASSGDSVIVAAATYTENLTIGLSLGLIGSGASATIIDGGGVNRVITVSNATALVTLSGVTIRNGTTLVYGGGIFNSGLLTINNCTVSGNQVFSRKNLYKYGYGGGIYSNGRLTINNSTINGNSVACGYIGCAGLGAGIYSNGRLTISNSTIAGNFAYAHFAYSQGGGIEESHSVLTISNSTLSGNGPVRGSGIYNDNGTATLQNSIVASSGGNCGGSTVTSNGYNLSSDTTCNLGGPGDLKNANPQLGPLQNNGGTTPTMALLTGSPAIDAGNPRGCTDGTGSNLLKTDQRGMPRPDLEDTGGCDMGAYESYSVEP
jgi:hypothetical protein